MSGVITAAVVVDGMKGGSLSSCHPPGSPPPAPPSASGAARPARAPPPRGTGSTGPAPGPDAGGTAPRTQTPCLQQVQREGGRGRERGRNRVEGELGSARFPILLKTSKPVTPAALSKR